MKRSTFGGWLLVLAAIGMVGMAQAAPSPQQAKKAKTAETALKKAATQAKNKKFKEAGVALKQAQAIYEELLGQGEDGLELAQGLHPQLATLHSDLELQGIKLDPLPDPEGMAGASAPMTAPGATSNSLPKSSAPAAPSKPGGIFALEIGPLLVEQCYGCHGEGQNNPSAQYDMDFFPGVLKGGARGGAVIPGNAAGSLMIKKLRGTDTDGDQMPRNRAPLTEEMIVKFEKWINEGARTDGVDISRRMKEAVAVAHAESVTPEELTKERADLAAHNWKLILPDAADEHEETANFLVYGNVGKDQLKEVAKIAEAQGAKLQKALKLPPGLLVKGRTTIYVFDKKYEYGEVGRMLEGRELPSSSRSHWNYTIVDAYICLLPAKNNEFPLAGLIGKELAGVLVASQGQVPHWLAEGSARNLAIKLDPKDTRYRQWQDDATAVVGRPGFKPETMLTAIGPDNDLAAFLFVKGLMADSGRYQKLLTALRERTLFDAAFKAAYDKTPAEMVAPYFAAPGRR